MEVGAGDRGPDFLRLDVVILVHKLLASVPPVACGVSLPPHFPTHWCTLTHTLTLTHRGTPSGSPRTVTGMEF